MSYPTSYFVRAGQSSVCPSRIQRKSAFSDQFNNIKERLVTRADPFHTHKILALLSLVSFFFRFSNVGKDDMAFDKYPALTVPTMMVHFLLNASSFLFLIPKKRIKHGGRIWPEYRLHALAFNVRSQICMLWYLYEQHYQLSPNYFANYVVVMFGMLMADMGSWSVGKKYQSNSVRGVDTHPAVKFLLSAVQFNGTSGLLFGVRRLTIPFLPIFVIQMTAFMGTLQRKNMIGRIGLFFFLCLIANSMRVQLYEYNRIGEHINYAVRIVGSFCALLRLSPLPKLFHPLQNKYSVWSFAYVGLCFARPFLEDIPILYFKLALAGILSMLVLAGRLKMEYYRTLESASHKKD